MQTEIEVLNDDYSKHRLKTISIFRHQRKLFVWQLTKSAIVKYRWWAHTEYEMTNCQRGAYY